MSRSPKTAISYCIFHRSSVFPQCIIRIVNSLGVFVVPLIACVTLGLCLEVIPHDPATSTHPHPFILILSHLVLDKCPGLFLPPGSIDPFELLEPGDRGVARSRFWSLLILHMINIQSNRASFQSVISGLSSRSSFLTNHFNQCPTK